MTDDTYFACQLGIIFTLVFFCALAAVTLHPQWFG